MRVAVLTLTRDRLDYTKRTFAALKEFAGCDYDHYVLDNGSDDGTQEWLESQDDLNVTLLPSNIGVARARNMLLDVADPTEYDVIVQLDNDCELTQPNTVRDLAAAVLAGNCILSPRILGLQNPPQPRRELRAGDEIILDIQQIGGIMLSAPAWVFDEYRYPESLPIWGLDDSHICAWFRAQGGTCGYVKRLEVWHMDGTDGQMQAYPEYFRRKADEYAGSAA